MKRSLTLTKKRIIESDSEMDWKYAVGDSESDDSSVVITFPSTPTPNPRKKLKSSSTFNTNVGSILACSSKSSQIGSSASKLQNIQKKNVESKETTNNRHSTANRHNVQISGSKPKGLLNMIISVDKQRIEGENEQTPKKVTNSRPKPIPTVKPSTKSESSTAVTKAKHNINKIQPNRTSQRWKEDRSSSSFSPSPTASSVSSSTESLYDSRSRKKIFNGDSNPIWKRFTKEEDLELANCFIQYCKEGIRLPEMKAILPHRADASLYNRRSVIFKKWLEVMDQL